jgi:release factor glutamine methyltransferase
MKSDTVDISVTGAVYPPTEDSYILAKNAPILKGRILDMCTGSGIVALTNAKSNPKNEVIGVDINPEAVVCATNNAKANKITNARFFVSDLFEKIEGKFDGITCNPPYLPSDEVDPETGITISFNDGDPKPMDKDAEVALSGGKDGREVTDKIIAQVGEYLNKGGSFLLLQSSLNDEKKTIRAFKDVGLSAKIIDQEDLFFEKLYVLKASKV